MEHHPGLVVVGEYFVENNAVTQDQEYRLARRELDLCKSFSYKVETCHNRNTASML